MGNVVSIVCWLCAAAGGPAVQNPSFEADAYARYPGVARVNGGKITGWRHKGNVGLNPWWGDAAKRRGPVNSFADNGRTPHGRQVALMQNVCTLWQSVPGFKAGRKYRVTYHENARRLNYTAKAPPRIKVTLGGQVVVSLHPVAPVDGKDARSLPYDFVESAVFEAPSDGAFDLTFVTTVGTRVTVLIDDVRIREVK